MKPYANLKALVIGVSRYADAQYDLAYARSDAEAVAQVLQGDLGFNAVSTLYDADATRAGILRFFEHELQKSNEDDGLLIFFAGHGITVPSGVGDDRGFLVPHDGDPKRPFANLSLTAIRDDYLPMIPAKHVFLVVDACYGGLALRDIQSVQQPMNALDETIVAELTRTDRKVRQVLAAGTKDQQVLDGGLFGHSVFTGRFLETLLEANPFVTGDYLGVRVKEKVARDAVERNHRQTPQFGYLVGGEGTFVFHRRVKTVVPSGPPPSDAYPQQEKMPVASSWEELTSQYWMDEDDIKSALDAWSAEKKRRLHPISQSATLTSVRNLCSVGTEAQMLVESRTLDFEAIAARKDDVTVVADFTQDIWSIPFRTPEGLVKQKYSWKGARPARCVTCSECSGRGEWICPECQGSKTVMCPKCDGTGKKRAAECGHCSGSTGYCSLNKCPVCHGETKVPCTKCKGRERHPCDHCGATGQVAEYPVINVVFDVASFFEFLADKKVSQLGRAREDWAVAFWERAADGKQVPPLPSFLPAKVRTGVEAIFQRFLNKASGRICRTSVSLSLIPVHECSLLHAGKPFKMYVSSVLRKVVAVENEPKTFWERAFS